MTTENGLGITPKAILKSLVVILTLYKWRVRHFAIVRPTGIYFTGKAEDISFTADFIGGQTKTGCWPGSVQGGVQYQVQDIQEGILVSY